MRSRSGAAPKIDPCRMSRPTSQNERITSRSPCPSGGGLTMPTTLQSNACPTSHPICLGSVPCGPGTRCGWTASTWRSRRPSSGEGEAAGRTAAAADAGLGCRAQHRCRRTADRSPLGGCRAAGKRQRAIAREQALAALADGMRACIHCRPDTELGVLG
ncbi:DUF6233 domain-containing protein [Streptomyces sp. NBC_01707]|uniref:DUF6233 domain-containing protein n=1 Tax=Streptomyces sp. NBC_01707 TaxID=2975914 RepID=UPI00352F6D5A